MIHCFVKLHIMKDISAMVNTFLKFFQRDAQMVPFLSVILEKLLNCFLKLFIRKAIAAAAVTPDQLMKIMSHLEMAFLVMIKCFQYMSLF